MTATYRKLYLMALECDCGFKTNVYHDNQDVAKATAEMEEHLKTCPLNKGVHH